MTKAIRKLLLFAKNSIKEILPQLNYKHTNSNWYNAGKGISRYPHKIMLKCAEGTIVEVDELLEKIKLHCHVENLIDVGCGEPDTITYLDTVFSPSNIYGFEPETNNYHAIAERYKDNTRIEIFPFAVSDFDGESSLHIHSESSSGHSLKLFSLSHHKIPVKTVRLDTWVTQSGVDTLDVVKIDTQGNDFEVIKGMAGMLDTVKVLLIEVWFDVYYSNTSLFYQVSDYLYRHELSFFNFSSLAMRKSGQLMWGDAIFVSNNILKKLKGY